MGLERLWDWRDCGTGKTVGVERLWDWERLCDWKD